MVTKQQVHGNSQLFSVIHKFLSFIVRASSCCNVQEHLPVRLSLSALQHWQQAFVDMGQEGKKQHHVTVKTCPVSACLVL